ncbi:hypothetical protein SAMN02745781_02805 [Vibrio gazogenes DSM 21264]|uniref:Uncharacterized protein n=1 Tax=Vibrio gazogenes DSM 21264 = NBRC 103151 TaxID=1123492 RepID=A0A1M5DBY5_VIBGA|nr:hypothetical protein SAMN02745781_02805 [Vibrio gazogenes DSM 21264] [Vibrio gazogenes DSM 21264 = NBRC 103151]SJN56005.1 hypothetical protein BQ6471_01839 [Vibrio gazogenes]
MPLYRCVRKIWVEPVKRIFDAVFSLQQEKQLLSKLLIVNRFGGSLFEH